MQRTSRREIIVSCWLFTTQNKSKQHLAEEKQRNTTILRDTPKKLSFIFIFF